MSDDKRTYPSKILLFGEYTILAGGEALALPFDRFSARWKKWSDPPVRYSLDGFLAYLKTEFTEFDLRLSDFEKDLAEGWRLDSNIPTGYGAGSSGAVVAAVFDRYAKPVLKQQSLPEILGLLARMENHYHTSSSGIDPLVSYYGQAYHIEPTAAPRNVEPHLPPRLFLLDTGHSRETAPLVKSFRSKYDSDSAFHHLIDDQLMVANRRAIENTLNDNPKTVLRAWKEISRLQLDQFQDMIPTDLVALWRTGLSENAFHLKLCGAGGGGFLLGHAKNPTRTAQLLDAYELVPLSK